MSNQLIFDNYLLLLKSTVEVYVHGTLESSNDKVRSLLNRALDSTLAMQDDTYKIMTDQGWYVINNTSPDEIKKCYHKIIDKMADESE